VPREPPGASAMARVDSPTIQANGSDRYSVPQWVCHALRAVPWVRCRGCGAVGVVPISSTDRRRSLVVGRALSELTPRVTGSLFRSDVRTARYR